MAAVTICSDFGAQENKICHCFHCFPIYLPRSDAMGPDAMIFVFECCDLRQLFRSPFLLIKGLFSSSSLFDIRVVSSAYLKLLFFPAVLIPACVSSSPAFHMMYSTYKLNKLGDDIQLWLTPFPIWNESIIPCLVLTVASWPAYSFLRRQLSWLVFPSF